jgi:hypothetical protein
MRLFKLLLFTVLTFRQDVDVEVKLKVMCENAASAATFERRPRIVSFATSSWKRYFANCCGEE